MSERWRVRRFVGLWWATRSGWSLMSASSKYFPTHAEAIDYATAQARKDSRCPTTPSSR